MIQTDGSISKDPNSSTNQTIVTPDIDGGTADNLVIGGTTPAAGTFTTLTGSTSTTTPTVYGSTASGGDITIEGSSHSTNGDVFLQPTDGNVGIKQSSFGTSAVGVLGIGSGTAPTTSPADAAQVWVQDNTGQGASGLAQLYMRDEFGVSGPVAFAQDQRECENRVEDLADLAPVTFTWDPGSLADGVGETSAAVAVPGATLGATAVQCIAPYDLQGITLNAWVDAAGSCKARLQNETGGTIDLASGTWVMQGRRI